MFKQEGPLFMFSLRPVLNTLETLVMVDINLQVITLTVTGKLAIKLFRMYLYQSCS